MKSHAPAPKDAPFSRPLLVDDVPDEGLDTDIVAEPAECDAIAATAGLPAVASMKVAFHVGPLRRGRLELQGEGQARITQTCVVSLEPFDSEISFPIEAVFAPQSQPTPPPRARRRNERGRASVEPETAAPPPSPEAEPLDPIVDGRIDLGAIAVEFLTLALDFYPRKPGVEFRDVVAGDADDETSSAFAALERLKDRS